MVAASDPKTAFEQFERSPQTIDLVLTDVMMPRMSGPELAERMLSRNPRLQVAFMTGYADEHLSRAGARQWKDARVVEKPFDAPTLLATVGEVLGRDGAPLQIA